MGRQARARDGFRFLCSGSEVGAEGGRVMTPENYMKEMPTPKSALHQGGHP
jgi:hypothetical protein